jgi:hypothetical protein
MNENGYIEFNESDPQGGTVSIRLHSDGRVEKFGKIADPKAHDENVDRLMWHVYANYSPIDSAKNYCIVESEKEKINKACMEWVRMDKESRYKKEEYIEAKFGMEYGSLQLSVQKFNRALRDLGKRGLIKKGRNGRWEPV